MSEEKQSEYLTIEEMKAVAWIEEYWLRRESFPPTKLLQEMFPEFSLKESLKHEVFLYALDQRGIKLPDSQDRLTNEQVAAVALLTNFSDKRSSAAKLRDIGISATKWQGWMKQKAFKEFVHDLAANNFMDSIHVAQEGLLRSVDRGNVDAIKFYLEATGRYTPQAQEVANVKLILSRILESIQIHVKDPEILRSIAADFERIMSGQEPLERKEIMI